MKKVIENLQKAVQRVRSKKSKSKKFIDTPTCFIKCYNRFHGHKSPERQGLLDLNKRMVELNTAISQDILRFSSSISK